MATVTTQGAATRSVRVKPSVGALAKEGGEAFASGNTAPWEFTLDTPQTDTNHALGLCFLMEVEAPPFPGSKFPREMIPALGFAHLGTLHRILLSIPKSSSPGVELTRSFCQVTPF